MSVARPADTRHGIAGVFATLWLAIVLAGQPVRADSGDWRDALAEGDYDLAVRRVDAAAGDTETAAIRELLATARARGLAGQPMWRALLHYKPAFGRGTTANAVTAPMKSQVDAAWFFQSATGKHDPQAELDATLLAFFADTAKAPMRLVPACRFVARRQWLAEQLGKAFDVVPDTDCPEYDRYRSYLDADHLTLIFPAAHPNSPSSAFGHTLLRIDKAGQGAASRLLNMSINFAAEMPPEVSGLSYAINGLGGGFPGKFRLLPYHIKLREYAQIENRDTWEYPVRLDAGQRNRVLAHAYEMLIAYFDYYFLSENCSYHLLSLLDVAFPEAPLTDAFGAWTIPIDTISLLASRGLLGDAEFVPSTIRTLRARREALTPEERALVLEAWRNGLASVREALSERSAERQAAMLDLLGDYRRYDRMRDDPGATALSEGEREVLSLRSRLGIRSEAPVVDEPAATPESGHGSSRVAIGAVRPSRGVDRVDLEFRPAYHDFRDPSLAYGTTAAIDFGRIVLSHASGDGGAWLSSITPIAIESIEPRGTFFKPVSWHTRLQWQRPEPHGAHRFVFNVGAGGAWGGRANRPVGFVFLESDLVETPLRARRVTLDLGASAGVHWEAVDGWRSGLEIDARRTLGEPDGLAGAVLWSSVALGRQQALVGELGWQRPRGGTLTRTVGVQFRRYF